MDKSQISWGIIGFIIGLCLFIPWGIQVLGNIGLLVAIIMAIGGGWISIKIYNMTLATLSPSPDIDLFLGGIEALLVLIQRNQWETIKARYKQNDVLPYRNILLGKIDGIQNEASIYIRSILNNTTKVIV